MQRTAGRQERRQRIVAAGRPFARDEVVSRAQRIMRSSRFDAARCLSIALDRMIDEVLRQAPVDG